MFSTKIIKTLILMLVIYSFFQDDSIKKVTPKIQNKLCASLCWCSKTYNTSNWLLKSENHIYKSKPHIQVKNKIVKWYKIKHQSDKTKLSVRSKSYLLRIDFISHGYLYSLFFLLKAFINYLYIFITLNSVDIIFNKCKILSKMRCKLIYSKTCLCQK